MKSISYFEYILQPKRGLNAQVAANPRSGALLKIGFDVGYGYADLFPWPEFGDSDLEQQLDFLKKGKFTAVLERTLENAKIDAELRAEKTNVFDSATALKNHFLALDLVPLDSSKLEKIKAAGFSSLKIKMGIDFESQITDLLRIFETTDLNVRLDFNASLNWAQFEIFSKLIPFEYRRRIEFIEDPLPWNPTLWKKAAQVFTLALDFEYVRVPWQSLAEVPFRYIILKPARQNPAEILDRALEFDCKIVVTHSMDHALGIAHAARVSQELAKKSPQIMADGGLLVSAVYELDDFSNQLTFDGAFFKGVKGTGVGFDSQLERTPWLALK